MSPNESGAKAEGDPRIVELAGRIADATPVDWAEWEPGPHSETLAGLRVLAALAEAHRGAAAEAEALTATKHGPALFRWGGLEVLRLIARGGFGEVFRAFDPALGRDVALKLRHAEAGSASGAARWIEEARRLARVRHPNVLTVFGTGVFDGRAGLWTELVEGETLEARLARLGPLGAREAAAIGLDLCAALAAVHAEGLVHADLKATNVMREGVGESAGAAASGRIVLMDFGSAHDLGPGAPEAWSLGTPLVSAPEVLAGGRPTPRSDLYSLGVLLFRSVAGRYPVEAQTLAELRSKLEHGERASLRALRPDLPAAFVLAVERALEPDPARRFADAGTMERALAESLAATARGSIREAPSPRRARWTLLAATAAAVVAAVSILAIRSARERSAVHGGAPAGSATGERSTAPPQGETAGRLPAASPKPAAGPAGSGPAAPPAVPPAPALVVDASMLRGVGSAAEPLADGARLTTGDHLFLEFESPDPTWVYVLDEDRTGETVVLFPVPGTDLANPLTGGVRHRLPGRVGERAFDWQVTSAGGHETFLIVASRRSLPSIEKRVAALEHAAPGHEVTYASLPTQALDDLRGVAGMAPAPEDASPSSGSRLRAMARRLASSPRRDVWTRLIEVANPGP